MFNVEETLKYLLNGAEDINDMTVDIQKELEEKFDELFGALDTNNED